MDTASEMMAAMRAREADASRLNLLLLEGLAGGSLTKEEARSALLAAAHAAHVAFPQYAGHWDGWGIGMVQRSIHTKAGFAFSMGDLALFQVTRVMGRTRVTAYSMRTGVDTSIDAWDIAEF